MALVLLLLCYPYAVTSIRLVVRKLVKVYFHPLKKEFQTKVESQNKKSFSVATKLAHY